MITQLVTNPNPKGQYTLQSRVQMGQTIMDYKDSTYKWNYQGSVPNQIGKNQCSESNTIYWEITIKTVQINKIKQTKKLIKMIVLSSTLSKLMFQ